MESIVPIEVIERKIYVIRGLKVVLSNDLAGLYSVEPRVLVQAVKRNITRFPDDYMLQLNPEEFTNLKSKIVISSWVVSGALPFTRLPRRGLQCYRAD